MRHVALWKIGLGLALAVQSAQADDPKQIVGRAIEAMGGEAALARAAAVHVRLKGVFYAYEDSKLTAEVFYELPLRLKATLRMPVGPMQLVITQALKERTAWVQTNDEVHDAEAKELADLQESAYVEHVTGLVPLVRSNGYTLKALGESTVQTTPVVGVQVESASHPSIKLYFDKTKHLLVKVEHSRPEASDGPGVLREEFPSDYREVFSAAPAEQVLKEAKIGLDEMSLFAFLKKHSISDDRLSIIRRSIQDLKDGDFEVREKAQKALQELGAQAVPFLAKAAKDSDPEVAGRARQCLESAGNPPDVKLPRAVVQVLAARQPRQLAETLLAYLPSAPDEESAQEIEGVLLAVATREGTADPVLAKAVNDKDPVRRRIAAVALGKERASVQLYIPGLKRARKSLSLREGKKYMEIEEESVRYFNYFPESLYARP